VPAHGDEQRTSLVLGWRWRWGGREVRAAYDAQLDARVDEQRETNGVLSAAQEALRPIDRIERPHACKNQKPKSKTIETYMNRTRVESFES
jgi:hypothetical protein